MPTLYVTEPGARIEKEYRRLLVTSKEDEVLLAVPLSQVSDVVLVGYCGATTPVILALLDAGIGLTFVSRSGELRGRLRPPEAFNLPLRRLQYSQGMQPVFCVEVARAIVQGKLTNCRTLALRILRKGKKADVNILDELHPQILRLEYALQKTGAATSLAQLRGLEGQGAKAYFAVLRRGLKWKDAGFDRRTRRPPKDPINALLSLGYTLLTNALITACEIVGLDPCAGFFHADKYGRSSLALDLVEEFRPLVVDSMLLRGVNNRIFKQKNFEPASGEGVFLTRVGLRKFFHQFSRRLNDQVYHPLAGRPLSYQKCFELQARQLRKVIEGDLERYIPFTTR